MSAPKHSMGNAEEISYGFLAARACIALDQALDSRPLSMDDLEVLFRASVFLSDISDGALITSGAVREGVSPTRSIRALDVAFGPLQALKKVAHDNHDIATSFATLSGALRTVTQDGYPAQSKADLKDAREFFDELSGWLVNDLNAKRRQARGRSRAAS